MPAKPSEQLERLVILIPRLPVEERSFNTTFNPMCEVFPKVATCDYIRFGRLGGGQSNKNAICILSLNIINDKVLIQYFNSEVQ